MTPLQRGAIRFQFALDGAPKQDLRRRVLRAINHLKAERYTEAEIKAIVANSDSAWQRYRRWYGEQFEAEAAATMVSPEAAQRWVEGHALPQADRRHLRSLEDPVGFSYLKEMRRREIRQRLRERNVRGQDLDDWRANVHYLAFMENREVARARRRLEEQQVG